MGTPEHCLFGHSALAPVLAQVELISLSLGFDNGPFCKEAFSAYISQSQSLLLTLLEEPHWCQKYM